MSSMSRLRLPGRGTRADPEAIGLLTPRILEPRVIDHAMRTRELVMASAAFLAFLGFIGSFLPEELLRFIGVTPEPQTIILTQVAAAAYLGFAAVNWTARGSVIGGIYGRPVTLGNFLHFAVVAVTLIKAIVVSASPGLVSVTVAYSVFATWFGVALFTHPGRGNSGSG